jgi:DNA-binding MarR family transcriptional regulator
MIKHHFKNEDYIRISLFLEHSNSLFNSSAFIKNFEILNIILFIYKTNNILGKTVQFKNLKQFTTKSDVYLSKLLRNGLNSGYIKLRFCTDDKRCRYYELTEKALDFISKLDFEVDEQKSRFYT